MHLWGASNLCLYGVFQKLYEKGTIGIGLIIKMYFCAVIFKSNMFFSDFLLAKCLSLQISKEKHIFDHDL